MSSLGKDPIGSLGHDGPLAVLSQNRVNLADFYKEIVAVVTNPSIDRGREGEAFSTSSLIGIRPPVGQASDAADSLLVVLETPLLPGGLPVWGSQEVAQEVARPDTCSVLGLLYEQMVATKMGAPGVTNLGDRHPGEAGL